MTGDERSAITNAIWLCQTCAKLIDSDESRYTVAIVRKWREISEEAARFDVENLTPKQVADLLLQTVVVSVNQSGGQTAHTIVNHAPRQRSITTVKGQLKDSLRTLDTQDYKIRLSSGDPEAERFAKELDAALKECGWKQSGFEFNLAGGYDPGVDIGIDEINQSRQVLLNVLGTLSDLGIRGNKYSSGINGIVITIGPNPEAVRDVKI